MTGIYSQLGKLISANTPAAMATVVRGERIGAKCLIAGDGVVAGGIDSSIDAAIVSDALEMLAHELSEERTYKVGGEEIEVFIETFPPPQRLIIVGAVHVAIPLHRLAK